ncbi:MAG: OmpA family protein, partial [Nannocystaceae bacterium]
MVTGNPPPPPPPPPIKKKVSRVMVTADAIEITEKIQFAYNDAEILEASFGLLEEIKTVILDHPEIKKISIEGHTDSDGSDDYNQSLSERRAAS